MPFQELRPARFSPSVGRWIEEPLLDHAITATGLRLVTFNVWFSERDFDVRADAMMKLLAECDADVIALQEVTPEFIVRARREQWLKDRYCLSDANGSTVRGYGVALLSRLPIERLALCDLPSSMDRHLLMSTYRVNGRRVAVATVHLESLREFAYVREHQLRKIFAILDEYDIAVLLGDLNFCSTWTENEKIPARYVDLWPLLKPDDAGFTLVPRETAEWGPVRFDRILVKSRPGAVKAKNVRLIGMEPIAAGPPPLYASDHFGLVGELEVLLSTDPSA